MNVVWRHWVLVFHQIDKVHISVLCSTSTLEQHNLPLKQRLWWHILYIPTYLNVCIWWQQQLSVTRSATPKCKVLYQIFCSKMFNLYSYNTLLKNQYSYNLHEISFLSYMMFLNFKVQFFIFCHRGTLLRPLSLSLGSMSDFSIIRVLLLLPRWYSSSSLQGSMSFIWVPTMCNKIDDQPLLQPLLCAMGQNLRKRAKKKNILTSGNMQ